MATKAELEAELAQLRKALSETKQVSSQDEIQSAKTPDQDSAQDASSLFEGQEFAGLFHQALEDLETLPNRKPVLTALGIFFVGYLLGRSGHRG